MQDQGFNGTGSRFNSRFEAGSPIYAKQLNDLAAGIQSALPQPYVGYGPSVSFTPGGGIIAGQLEDTPVGAGYCPLEIHNLREIDGSFYINVAPGMVNNLVVKSDDGVLLTDEPPPNIQVFHDGLTTTEKTNYVYIQCGNTAGPTPPAAYPARSGLGYPMINVQSTEKTDTDSYSYILIGIVKGQKVEVPGSDPPTTSNRLSTFRMIGCNSLWTERFKCGTTDAVYWWSAV